MDNLYGGHLGKRVARVNLMIGAFSTVIPECMHFNFEVARRGTIFSDAELVIKIIPLEIYCKECKKNSEPAEPVFVCPICDGNDVEIIKGRDLRVESFEID